MVLMKIKMYMTIKGCALSMSKSDLEFSQVGIHRLNLEECHQLLERCLTREQSYF